MTTTPPESSQAAPSADALAGMTPTPDAAPAAAPGSVEELPDWAQKLIRDTRSEAAQYRTKAAADSRAARVELAVLKAAGSAGADPDALTDSRAFMDTIAALDPAAPDFTSKVTAAVHTATASNPRLMAAQVAARGGGDHTGGTTPDSANGEPMQAMEALVRDVASNRTIRRRS